MGNTLYDKLKLMHDIEERQEIINRYQRHSAIDRARSYKKEWSYARSIKR